MKFVIQNTDQPSKFLLCTPEHYWVRKAEATRFDTVEEADAEISWVIQHVPYLRDGMQIVKSQ